MTSRYHHPGRALATLLTLTLLLIACSGATEPSDETADTDVGAAATDTNPSAVDAGQSVASPTEDVPTGQQTAQVAFALAQQGAQWSDRIEFGAQAAADGFDGDLLLDIEGPPALDPTQGVQVFQSQLLKQPDGVVLIPLPPEQFLQPAETAVEDGILVVSIIVAPIPDGPGTLYVGENANDLGRAAAEVLAEQLESSRGPDPSGVVIGGTCVPGLSTLDGRLAGAQEVLSERFPNLEFPEPILTSGEQSESFPIWETAVQSNPDAVALYDACEQGGAALAEIKADGGHDFEIIAWDLNDPIIAGVQNGAILAVVPQRGFVQGFLSTELLGRHLVEGQELPQGWLEYPIDVVTGDNIDALVEAESSPEAMRSYHQAVIDEVLADIQGHLRPLSEASGL